MSGLGFRIHMIQHFSRKKREKKRKRAPFGTKILKRQREVERRRKRKNPKRKNPRVGGKIGYKKLL